MRHPGLACAAADGIAAAREVEFPVRWGMEFGELLDKAQIHMLPMRRILAPA